MTRRPWATANSPVTKTAVLLVVAAATRNAWVAAIELYWAARVSGPLLEALHRSHQTRTDTSTDHRNAASNKASSTGSTTDPSNFTNPEPQEDHR